MKKISLYILLILIFLGVSTSYSPKNKSIIKIPSELVYPTLFKEGPISVVLIDAFYKGFIINSYFHKYKVFLNNQAPQTITIRTTRKYWHKTSRFIGMSLFRRYDSSEDIGSTTPMPPGIVFIGNTIFGKWVKNDSGKTNWQFYNAYFDFPKLFSWKNFKPDQFLYEKIKRKERSNTPFFGNNDEFGNRQNKIVTQSPNTRTEYDLLKNTNWKKHILGFFRILPQKKLKEKYE